MYVIRRTNNDGRYTYAELDSTGLYAWRDDPSRATNFQDARDAQEACQQHLNGYIDFLRIVPENHGKDK